MTTFLIDVMNESCAGSKNAMATAFTNATVVEPIAALTRLYFDYEVSTLLTNM